MIGCKHFLWVHTMKTGGQWLRQAVLPTMPKQWDLVHIDEHVPLSQAVAQHPRLKGVPTFCHIRNPWDWYRSFYTFMKQHWDDKTGCYALPRNQWRPIGRVWATRFESGWKFAEYVRHAGHQDPHPLQPTSLTRHFRVMGGFEVDHVVPYENLRKGTHAVLQQLCGGRLPPLVTEALLRAPARNTSRHLPTATYYTPELIERVYELDREIIDRFGYDPPKLAES